MSDNEVRKTGMRPFKGQTSLILPVTFDYSGGRRDSNKTTKMWSGILLVVGAVISLGLVISDGIFILNLIKGFVFFYVVLFIVRFALNKEGKLRREETSLRKDDFALKLSKVWGIYHIDDNYPYYCRFRNGKTGVFVELNKDVILGKHNEAEFSHYEAIGDAYNICGSSKIQMCHIDYMDYIGMDDRLDISFASLSKVSNPDVKDLLTDVFEYQKEQMSKMVTTFDVYLFLWTGSNISAWESVKRILNCFMQANYKGYRVLSANSLRLLPKTLLNLEDFSIVDAMSQALSDGTTLGVKPIRKVEVDGSVTVINKTTEERREELKLKEAELNKKKKSKNLKPAKTSSDLDDSDIDLFE